MLYLVPMAVSGDSPTLVMSPVRQPFGGGDMKSINEAAELTSIPVERVNVEERVNVVEKIVNVVEERVNAVEKKVNVVEERNTTTEERKFHGKTCLF